MSMCCFADCRGYPVVNALILDSSVYVIRPFGPRLAAFDRAADRANVRTRSSNARHQINGSLMCIV